MAFPIVCMQVFKIIIAYVNLLGEVGGCGAQSTTVGADLSFHPVAQEFSRGHRAWQSALLLAEPSSTLRHLPHYFRKEQN